MIQYSPKIASSGLVFCTDAGNNKSYPFIALPVKADCILHLDANDATSIAYSTASLVRTWFDKSGNKNNLIQETSSLQPSRSGTQNSRSTVVFSLDYLTSERSILRLSESYTKIVVTKQTSSGGSGNIIGKSTGGDNTFWYGSSTSIKLYHNANTILSSGIATPNNSWSISTGIFNFSNRSASIYVNGTLAASTASAPRPIAGSDVQLGAYANGNNFDGEIAEVIIYNRVLTDFELINVHTYLGNKWGILNTDRNWLDLTRTVTGSLFSASGSGALISDIIYNQSPPYFRLPQVNAGGARRYEFPVNSNVIKGTGGTIELVARFAYTSAGSNTCLFHSLGSGTNRFIISGSISSGPLYSLQCHRGTSALSTVLLNSNVGINNWFHVAMSWNNTNMVGYLNGSLRGSTIYTNASDPTSFIIGGTGTNEQCFPGDIGLCRIYNRKLTDDEVYINYDQLKSRFN
jgi:hypothetical protein